MNKATFVSTIVGVAVGLEFLVGSVSAQTNISNIKKDKNIITVEESSKPKIFFGTDLDPVLSGVYNFGGEFDKIKIEGIPLSIRNVPIHKDDWTPESYKGPIVPDELSNKNFSIRSAVKIYIGVKDKEWNVQAGITGVVKGTVQEINERDYTIDPVTGIGRQGSAYTFMKQNDIKLLYGFFIKAATLLHDEKIKKMDGKIYLTTEYKRLSENYRIITGWDRYNKLETYKKHDIATIVLNELEAGPEYKDKHQIIGLYVGYTIPQLMRTTDIAKLMNIYTPSFISLRVSYGLILGTRDKKHK